MAPIWRRVGGSEYYVNVGPVRQPVGPGMVTTCWNVGGCQFYGPPFGEFETVDLTQPPWSLPADAAFADLQGVGGMTGGPGYFGVIYRAPGDTSVACSFVSSATNNFAVQILSPTSGINAGARQNASVRVPLTGGKFQFCWLKDSLHSSATYFWNPSIVGWGRVER